MLPLAVERGFPGIWFTPLLHEDRLLQAAVGSRSPTLLVGGSADPSWDSGAAAASGQRVVEVAGADHSLEVAGDVAASIHALEQVVSEVAAFLDVLG